MIKVKQEFVKLIPPLQQSERDLLEASLLAEGCRDAIILWGDYIVDGHNRFAICSEHNIDFETVQKEFEDENEAMLWMLDNQAGRRNLTDGWKLELVQKKREILMSAGREKQNKTLGGFKHETSVLSFFDKTDKPHNTRNEIARELGWSTGKTAQAQYVWDHAPDEVKDEVKSGEVSIHKAYMETKKAKRREENESKVAPPVPDGKYRVIYADPPWKYTSGSQHSREEQETVLETHYPSMTLREICDLPIEEMADDNAVLFLWTTSPLLEESFQVVNSWGFKYKASIIWNKMKHNVGHYVSVRHEILLICTRGSCTPDSGKLLPSVVDIERTAHSVKPEYFRKMVESMYTYGSKIELFARRKVDGWDVWGNEA